MAGPNDCACPGGPQCCAQAPMAYKDHSITVGALGPTF